MELVDITDLNSVGFTPCGFESHHAYQIKRNIIMFKWIKNIFSLKLNIKEERQTISEPTKVDQVPETESIIINEVGEKETEVVPIKSNSTFSPLSSDQIKSFGALPKPATVEAGQLWAANDPRRVNNIFIVEIVFKECIYGTDYLSDNTKMRKVSVARLLDDKATLSKSYSYYGKANK